MTAWFYHHSTLCLTVTAAQEELVAQFNNNIINGC